MSFFDDMEKALLEAIEIEKGNVSLKERNIETKSLYVLNDEEKLIDELEK